MINQTKQTDLTDKEFTYIGHRLVILYENTQYSTPGCRTVIYVDNRNRDIAEDVTVQDNGSLTFVNGHSGSYVDTFGWYSDHVWLLRCKLKKPYPKRI